MGQDRLEKLIAKRETMNARIRQELGRERSRQRRQDTRRKILAGAIVLNEQDPEIKAWLYRTLGKALVRKDERDLFGLPPLPGEKPTLVSAEGQPPASESAAALMGQGGMDEQAARAAR